MLRVKKKKLSHLFTLNTFSWLEPNRAWASLRWVWPQCGRKGWDSYYSFNLHWSSGGRGVCLPQEGRWVNAGHAKPPKFEETKLECIIKKEWKLWKRWEHQLWCGGSELKILNYIFVVIMTKFVNVALRSNIYWKLSITIMAGAYGRFVSIRIICC